LFCGSFCVSGLFVAVTDLVLYGRFAPEFVLADPKTSERLKRAAKRNSLSMADLNGNSRIDFAEFLFFQLLAGLSLKEIELAFKVIDTDGSNSLDADEFLAMLQTATHSTGISHQPKIVALFGRDGKRKASLAEFKKWFTSLKKEVALLEFQLLDVNDDGKGVKAGCGSFLFFFPNTSSSSNSFSPFFPPVFC
jgi:Ca2+-binding EF-hand superfamily protein